MDSHETIIVNRLARIVAREEMLPEPDEEKVLIARVLSRAVSNMARWNFSATGTLEFVAVELNALDQMTQR